MAEQRPLQHVGIIMDGNRRWAKKAGKLTAEGHRQGYKALKELLLGAVKELDLEYVTVYAFSTENWNRAKDEVEGLIKLLRWVLKNEIDELARGGARLRWVGSEENIPDDLLKMMRESEDKTKDNTQGTIAICFNYGGHQEIVDAANAAAANGEITKKTIEENLYAPDIPPIDLVIRTSGEHRISNFMLWRMEYAELAFTDTLWPDFTGDEFKQIVEDFSQRSRRFGA